MHERADELTQRPHQVAAAELHRREARTDEQGGREHEDAEGLVRAERLTFCQSRGGIDFSSSGAHVVRLARALTFTFACQASLLLSPDEDGNSCNQSRTSSDK